MTVARTTPTTMGTRESHTRAEAGWRSTAAERPHAYTGPAALTICAKETEPYVVPSVPAVWPMAWKRPSGTKALSRTCRARRAAILVGALRALLHAPRAVGAVCGSERDGGRDARRLAELARPRREHEGAAGQQRRRRDRVRHREGVRHALVEHGVADREREPEAKVAADLEPLRDAGGREQRALVRVGVAQGEAALGVRVARQRLHDRLTLKVPRRTRQVGLGEEARAERLHGSARARRGSCAQAERAQTLRSGARARRCADRRGQCAQRGGGGQQGQHRRRHGRHDEQSLVRETKRSKASLAGCEIDDDGRGGLLPRLRYKGAGLSRRWPLLAASVLVHHAPAPRSRARRSRRRA